MKGIKIMALRKAEALWKGGLQDGGGTVKVGSGLLDAPYTFKARVEDEAGATNPEELLGAAHASCYAMFLSATLGRSGFTVNHIQATASVTLERGEAGLKIAAIALDVEGSVEGIDEAAFLDYAEKAKTGCPVSQALASIPSITLNAKLV
jgi:osmotically inducible protein OsmC